MKVVEAEVAKRLAAEREKDEEERKAREKEEAEMRAREEQERAAQVHSSPSKRSASLPSGVLTPLLKKHKDLDDELRARLQDLERKLWVIHSEISPFRTGFSLGRYGRC